MKGGGFLCLHVEEDAVREEGGDEVGEDEVCAGRVADETERHDG